MPDDSAILSMLGSVQSAVEAARAETTGAVNGLRTELSGRMDQMITRREHEAEVRRIDSDARATARAIEDTRQALADHETAGEARREEAVRQRIADRRWLVGACLSAIAATSAVTGTIVAILGG